MIFGSPPQFGQCSKDQFEDALEHRANSAAPVATLNTLVIPNALIWTARATDILARSRWQVRPSSPTTNKYTSGWRTHTG